MEFHEPHEAYYQLQDEVAKALPYEQEEDAFIC